MGSTGMAAARRDGAVRRIVRAMSALVAATMLTSCGGGGGVDADLVLEGGLIWYGPGAPVAAGEAPTAVAIDDGRWAENRIGPERIKTTYAFRSLLDAGARLAFGSDWTVAPIDPLQGIFAAVTRRTIDGANPDGWVPEERNSVAEAVAAYTTGNAHASFLEDELGELTPGRYADLVVLSDDIFTIDPRDIANVKVDLTIVEGEVVSRRPG